MMEKHTALLALRTTSVKSFELVLRRLNSTDIDRDVLNKIAQSADEDTKEGIRILRKKSQETYSKNVLATLIDAASFLYIDPNEEGILQHETKKVLNMFV